MNKPDTFVFYQLCAPGQLELLPDPRGLGGHSTPDAEQIICRTEMSALSPGTELSAYRGDPPLRPQAIVYPRLQGYCNVSTILKCGAKVPKHLKEGDRVITQQSHRSGFMIPYQEALALLPADMDARTASVTYLFHLGYSAFLKSGAVQGDRAAILGLGTLGLTTAALFKAGGIPMTVFSNFDQLCSTVRHFGLGNTLPKKVGMNSNKFDHVVVTTNEWADWKMALELCAPGGKITTLGFPGRGQAEPNFNPLDSRYFYDKQLTIQSCGYMPTGINESRRDRPRAIRFNFEFLLEAISDGRIPAAALIKESRSYLELGEVYSEMLAGDRSALTTVLDWSDS